MNCFRITFSAVLLLCIVHTKAQTCADTSVRREISKDGLQLNNVWISGTQDGDVLITGWRVRKAGPLYNGIGHLIKTTPNGTILWSKSGQLTDTFSTYIVNVFELADGSILATGSRYVPRPINYRDDLMMMRLSSSGDIIWQKFFGYKLWTPDSTGSAITINDAISTASGEIYLAGQMSYSSNVIPRIALVAKLSAADGTLIWSKGLPVEQLGVARALGINLANNQLQVLGNSSADMLGFALNPATGDTLFTRRWTIPDNYPNNFWRSFNPSGFTRLKNGNLVMYGRANTDQTTPFPGPFRNFMTFEVTPSLNFVRSYVLTSTIMNNNGNSRITVYPDGSAAFSKSFYQSSWGPRILFGKMIDGQVVKERLITSYGQRSVGWISNFVPVDRNGDFLVQSLTDSFTIIQKMEMLRLHDSDTSSDCTGFELARTSVTSEQFVLRPVLYDTVRPAVLVEVNHLPFVMVADNLDVTNTCASISFCDTLKLIPSGTILCPSTPLRITARKNRACGVRPAWKYDTAGIKSFTYVNDSTVEIKFDSVWSGYISAFINGCTPLRDSVFIRVLRTPPFPELGPDTVICPGNTVLLNARGGYASYLWQDGSSDSIFLVTTPGKYYVRVQDACGNTLSDTVNVNPHPPIPFELGADLVKCNADTLQLTAPAGFINYTWSPSYNISSLNTQSVKLYPFIDTVYKLRAEKTPGCFVYDSIRVSVNHSPSINLGRDTSFCNGDSIVLAAGAGFNSYAWSNGSNASQVTVRNAGRYSVIATTAQGCKSYDTLQVNNVYANPVVNLNKDTAICSGAVKLLDAGNFSNYAWSNGATTRNIVVNNAGTYWVKVTDNNGCQGSDTSRLAVLWPLPAAFLPQDTAVCTYGEVLLKPSGTYVRYLWSNNSITPSITVSKVGRYYLAVTDKNNCTGSDTINVTQKDCLSGFFVPNAFTPDGKRSNNTFRPLIFGNVVKYRFSVYNRWGQLVFDSIEPGRGWDGTIAGKPQDSNVYVWVCTYQFSGEPVKNEKGSVVLVR